MVRAAPGAALVELLSCRRDDVDDTQALFATAFLPCVGRDEDVAAGLVLLPFVAGGLPLAVIVCGLRLS